MAQIIRFQLRRGTAADWTAANPVLAAGEPGVESDTRLMKVGNGTSPWNSLQYSTLSEEQVQAGLDAADAAAAEATAAGTSAFNAGQSAAAALGHRNAAEGFKNDAATHVAEAAAIRDGIPATNDAIVKGLLDNPGSATAEALNATYLDKTSGLVKSEASSTYQRPVKNTIAYIGDSHTDYGEENTASLVAYIDRGFSTWAQVILGHRLEAVINAGIQGQRADQIRARIQTDVIAHAPGWCHVLAGTNDMLQDRALASVKADLLAMWTDLRNAGIRVIAGTIPPCNGLTAPRQAFLHDLNAWIREQGSKVPGLIVVDYHSVLADPATDGWYSNYALPDGIHTSRVGAAAMGKALAAAIADVVPPRPRLVTTNTDPFNLVPNPMLTGNTNGQATTWANQTLGGATGTATPSKVARTDGKPGEMQQFVVAAGQASAGLDFRVYTPSAINYTPGDKVYGVCEVEMGDDIANFQFIRLSVMPVTSALAAITPFAVDMEPYLQSTVTSPTFRLGKAIFRTPILTTPLNSARIILSLTFKGEGTIRIGSMGLINATKLAARTA